MMGTLVFRRISTCSVSALLRSYTNRCLVNKPVPIASVQHNLITYRNYAKSKDKGKEKKTSKSAKVEINTVMMAEVIDVDSLKIKCFNAIEKMKDDFAKNLSLRSTTGSIETVRVKFEGKEYELQELAQIIRKNPQTLVLNFISFPQVIPNALRAIATSGLNLNPQQDGTTVYVPVPKVTKEHRESLAKNAKALYIKCRDNIKDVQNEFIKKSKKKEKAPEDLVFSVQKQIIALCDEYDAKAKKLLEEKQDELLNKT